MQEHAERLGIVDPATLDQLDGFTVSAYQLDGSVAPGGNEACLQRLLKLLPGITDGHAREVLSDQRGELSQALNAYEQTHQVIVPTPGTILDAGNKVTHKLLVVRLYLQGLSTTEIAKRTYHSEQAVDTYIGAFDQVTALYWYGVPRSIMRLVLRRSLWLIDEYLQLVDRCFKDRETVRAYLDGRGIKVA